MWMKVANIRAGVGVPAALDRLHAGKRRPGAYCASGRRTAEDILQSDERAPRKQDGAGAQEETMQFAAVNSGSSCGDWRSS